MFASSASFAWVSPMIPLLQQPDSPIPISSDEGGWLVFAIMIGRIVAIVPGALAMDRYATSERSLAFAAAFAAAAAIH